MRHPFPRTSQLSPTLPRSYPDSTPTLTPTLPPTRLYAIVAPALARRREAQAEAEAEAGLTKQIATLKGKRAEAFVTRSAAPSPPSQPAGEATASWPQTLTLTPTSTLTLTLTLTRPHAIITTFTPRQVL